MEHNVDLPEAQKTDLSHLDGIFSRVLFSDPSAFASDSQEVVELSIGFSASLLPPLSSFFLLFIFINQIGVFFSSHRTPPPTMLFCFGTDDIELDGPLVVESSSSKSKAGKRGIILQVLFNIGSLLTYSAFE